MEYTNPLADFVDRETIAAMFKVSPRTITRWSGQPDGIPYLSLAGC
jgi:phage terminase Nu1 subunit (DNA packaging protein)